MRRRPKAAWVCPRCASRSATGAAALPPSCRNACSSPSSPPAPKAPASASRSPVASRVPTAATSSCAPRRAGLHLHPGPAAVAQCAGRQSFDRTDLTTAVMIEQLNILVVEDDAALRDAVCFTLEMAHHAVTGVDGGPAALAELERQRLQPRRHRLAHAADGRPRAAARGAPPLAPAAGAADDGLRRRGQGGGGDARRRLRLPDEALRAQVLLENVRRYAAAATRGRGHRGRRPAHPQPAGAGGACGRDPMPPCCSRANPAPARKFRALHPQHSPRSGRPFIAINCAAIPENLLEATLFGYEKGAFTGAQAAQPGKFEQAQGGTILLDEISEMPLGLQAKLLRVLQEREVERVGGKKPVALDIRVLATSNRDMLKEVAAGRFREDLVLPPQRVPDRHPGAARTPGRHPAAGPTLPRPPRRAPAAPGALCARGRGAAGALRLARATCASWRTPCTAC